MTGQAKAQRIRSLTTHYLKNGIIFKISDLERMSRKEMEKEIRKYSKIKSRTSHDKGYSQYEKMLETKRKNQQVKVIKAD